MPRLPSTHYGKYAPPSKLAARYSIRTRQKIHVGHPACPMRTAVMTVQVYALFPSPLHPHPRMIKAAMFWHPARPCKTQQRIRYCPLQLSDRKRSQAQDEKCNIYSIGGVICDPTQCSLRLKGCLDADYGLSDLRIHHTHSSRDDGMRSSADIFCFFRFPPGATGYLTPMVSCPSSPSPMWYHHMLSASPTDILSQSRSRFPGMPTAKAASRW